MRAGEKDEIRNGDRVGVTPAPPEKVPARRTIAPSLLSIPFPTFLRARQALLLDTMSNMNPDAFTDPHDDEDDTYEGPDAYIEGDDGSDDMEYEPDEDEDDEDTGEDEERDDTEADVGALLSGMYSILHSEAAC